MRTERRRRLKPPLQTHPVRPPRTQRHPRRKPRTATPRCAVPAPHTHPGAFLRAHQGHAGWGAAPPARAQGLGVPGARNLTRRRSGEAPTPGLQGRRAGARPRGDLAAGVSPRPSPHGPSYATLPAPRPRPAANKARAKGPRAGDRLGAAAMLAGATGTGRGRRTKERAPAPGPARRARPAGGAEGRRPRTMRPGPRAALT